jgi:hypothetical protein
MIPGRNSPRYYEDQNMAPSGTPFAADIFRGSVWAPVKMEVRESDRGFKKSNPRISYFQRCIAVTAPKTMNLHIVLIPEHETSSPLTSIFLEIRWVDSDSNLTVTILFDMGRSMVSLWFPYQRIDSVGPVSNIFNYAIPLIDASFRQKPCSKGNRRETTVFTFQ